MDARESVGPTSVDQAKGKVDLGRLARFRLCGERRIALLLHELKRFLAIIRVSPNWLQQSSGLALPKTRYHDLGYRRSSKGLAQQMVKHTSALAVRGAEDIEMTIQGV